MKQPKHTTLPLATAGNFDIANEKLYDRQDLLLMLHISVRTLQYWRTNGLLPYHKIGNKIYYRQRDVEEMLIQNKVVKK